MNKTEKMRGVVALCSVALTNAKELQEALTNELKILYKALGIDYQDSEKIQDPALFKIALDLEFNADNLRSCAEDLESVIKDLDKIKI